MKSSRFSRRNLLKTSVASAALGGAAPYLAMAQFGKTSETAKSTSAELAADKSLIPIWDPSVAFPSPRKMRDLDVVTHVVVERAQAVGYHYLLTAVIMHHRDRFYMGWLNHAEREYDDSSGVVIRGSTSSDAIHWNKPAIWAQAGLIPQATSFLTPVLFSHHDTLYGFFLCWYKDNPLPATELFILNESTGQWEWQQGSAIPRFHAMGVPERLDNGNWILSGEDHWDDAAVAISDGDDFTKWRMVTIPRPEEMKLRYPESAIINQGNNKLISFSRPSKTRTAPVAMSNDGGETWTTLGMSNFPLAKSKPFAGKLTTGHNYLLTNSLEDGRCLLSIALTDANGGLFKHIFKVRHQQWPARRVFVLGTKNYVGQATEWSYPSAFEYNGNLYVAYSQGKEDCVLSIIPIEALTAPKI